ncbi:Kunitz trypsin inhibitor 2 [Bienertia sinuspersici]
MATHHFIATFLLIIFVSNCSVIKAQVVVNVIHDTNGDILKTGTKYYILPVVQRLGGGIATAPTNANQTCPLSVVQLTDTSALGLPVVFYSNGKSVQNVTFDDDMNLVFDAPNTCGGSSVWEVKLTEATKFVGLGGKSMVRGPNFVNIWFRIERFFPSFHFDYKLTFCPTKTICPLCKVKCGDLGVVDQGGVWRLVVGASPLRIKFKKA